MNISDKMLEEDWLKARTKLPNKRSRYFYKSEIKIPKKSLVMMCGTPGAGKTTIARKICSQLKDSIHVDIDYLFDCATKTLYPNAQSLSVEDIDLIAKEAYDKAYRNEEEILANIVKSPMVGTFYLKPAPDKEDFVKVGDIVKKGQVLCIIEAMKLMNEIESEYDGQIVEICTRNEEMVDYGKPLFKIK